MSEYRVETVRRPRPEFGPGITKDGDVVAWCPTKNQAEYVARALAVLTAMEREQDDPALCPAGHGPQCCRNHAACEAALSTREAD